MHPWDWAHWDSTSGPPWAVESLHDRDVFRFQIDQEGTYHLSLAHPPDELGIWAVWEGGGPRRHFSSNGPLESLEGHYQPGVYHVGVGATFESKGDTGPYVLSLVTANQEDAAAANP